MDLVNNFTCQCVEGFEGRFCEVNTDDCAKVFCRNGGSCEDEVANFTCQCVEGFEGRFCERLLPVSPCASSLCDNASTCVSDSTREEGYRCVCPLGTAGPFCQQGVYAHTYTPCSCSLYLPVTVSFVTECIVCVFVCVCVCMRVQYLLVT